MDEQDLTQLSKAITDSAPTALEATEGLATLFTTPEMQGFVQWWDALTSELEASKEKAG